MATSNWIALAALFVSLALPLLLYRLERRDRRTEVGLLRQQVEGEEAERAAKLRAEVVAESGRIDRGVSVDHHFFAITNTGPPSRS